MTQPFNCHLSLEYARIPTFFPAFRPHFFVQKTDKLTFFIKKLFHHFVKTGKGKNNQTTIGDKRSARQPMIRRTSFSHLFDQIKDKLIDPIRLRCIIHQSVGHSSSHPSSHPPPAFPFLSSWLRRQRHLFTFCGLIFLLSLDHHFKSCSSHLWRERNKKSGFAHTRFDSVALEQLERGWESLLNKTINRDPVSSMNIENTVCDLFFEFFGLFFGNFAYQRISFLAGELWLNYFQDRLVPFVDFLWSTSFSRLAQVRVFAFGDLLISCLSNRISLKLPFLHRCSVCTNTTHHYPSSHFTKINDTKPSLHRSDTFSTWFDFPLVFTDTFRDRFDLRWRKKD